MKATFNDVKNIYDILPIGYYLGRRIDHKLDTGKDSYYDPKHDRIVISAPTVIDAIEPVDEADIALEELIRSILYHEISHVLLTPDGFFTSPAYSGKSYNKYKDALNIFEDERIETIFKNFYYGVNFKKTVKSINHYNGQSPKSASELYYQIVRYRVGPEKFVSQVKKLIFRYKNINATYSEKYINEIGRYSDRSYRYNEMSNLSELNRYRDDIITLYRDIVKYWDSKDAENNKNTKSKKSADSTDDVSDNSDSNNSEMDNPESDNVDSTNSKMDSSEDDTAEADISEIDSSVDPEEDAKFANAIRKAISSIVNTFYDATLVNKLNQIIANKRKQNKKNGSAINSYSGRLDIHSVANRDDYKWWSQENRNSHIKAYSKVHFNLFVDNSGSFSNNDGLMNTFIQSLNKNKNSNFSFDVITINTQIDEWINTNRLFMSNGGNCLTDDIARVIRKHTKPQTSNFNIVLFDGDAHSDDSNSAPYKGGSTDAFRHFDSPNTIIISDRQNEKYINASVHKAKVTYTRNYCEEFIGAILELLERML